MTIALSSARFVLSNKLSEHTSMKPGPFSIRDWLDQPSGGNLYINWREDMMSSMQTDLPLADVLALDRVQKKLPIPDEAASRLRKSRLIEGRKPNYFISAEVAKATASVADYLRTRAQDDDYYAKLITDYLKLKGSASREDINGLLMSKLSDALDEKQKDKKISNLLTNLRRKERIRNTGSRGHPAWKLAE